MNLPIIRAVPPALDLDALRDAFANHHLPVIVKGLDRDGVKVTLGKGTDRKSVEMFLAGFIAGFSA